MTTRGIWKLHGIAQTIEARKDWSALVQTALRVPVAEIEAVTPKPEYGWRRIDKCIAKLRALIEKHAQVTS